MSTVTDQAFVTFRVKDLNPDVQVDVSSTY